MATVGNRSAQLARLTAETLDVLVVGGGIVGSGVARDAAMRGLRSGLVEKHDFAYGTSSRSSRLLHGGLRYLEQGRVGLVREASVEKKTLAKIAPHLAEPLGFIFPSYRGEGRPLWQLRIGVRLYDFLCGGGNFQPSRGFNQKETIALLPDLNREKLAGAVRYFDALTNDARLVLDTIRSAEKSGGAVANYAQLIGAERRGDLWLCDLTDRLTHQSFQIRTRTIVNATGPWAQQIPHSSVRLRLSKGIHVVIDRQRLNVPSAVVITEGKRLLFVLPWGERIIIGTTDTDFVGTPESVSVEPSDLAYVLRIVNEFFPHIALSSADIISSWAGLRPLIANPDGSPSDISRAHQILCPEPGWWDVAGGKLTTYRLMAEQTVDQISRYVGGGHASCRTAQEPLLPAKETRFSGILPAAFGKTAVEYFVKHEWAYSLEDVLVRRSGWHYFYPDAAKKAEEVAAWMAEISDWSPARCRDEIANYRAATSSAVRATGVAA